MELIQLTMENLENEHICCAFSDKKCAEGYNLKKAWLKDRFKEGYVFKKYDVRHKVFIEYTKAETAWSPVEAPGYLYIGCYWVAGQYKGHGHGKSLLRECLNDAEGASGVVVVTGKKKMPFLADKKFFLMQGFEICDTAPPHFELLVKRTNESAPAPRFIDSAKTGECPPSEGLTVYYTNQCPFTEYYVHHELQAVADAHNLPLEIKKIDTLEKAKASPTPFPIYTIFYKGVFLTHEIMTLKRFDKLLPKLKEIDAARG